MNKFLSAISIIIASIALAVSGWSTQQSLQLNSSIKQQQDTIAKQQQELTQLSREIAENKTLLSSKTSQQVGSTAANFSQQNNEIQPGQFVRQGFDNKVKFELFSVKRVQNPDSDEKDVVVVKLKMRRIVPKGKVDAVSLNQSRGRNPETNEVYRTVTNRSTALTYINSLPEDSWGNAYFWLKVPEGIDAIDIVIPETAIFEQVPIAS